MFKLRYKIYKIQKYKKIRVSIKVVESIKVTYSGSSIKFSSQITLSSSSK